MSPVHAMRAYRGTRDITPLILNFNTSCRLGFNFTSWSLYSRGITSTYWRGSWMGPPESVRTVCRR